MKMIVVQSQEEAAEVEAFVASQRMKRDAAAARRDEIAARSAALDHERNFRQRHGEEHYPVPDNPDGTRIYADGARRNRAGDFWEPPADEGERAAARYTFCKLRYAYLREQYRIGHEDITGAVSLLAKGARVRPPTDAEFAWLEAAAERVREAERDMRQAWERTPTYARQRDRDRRDADRRAEASALQHRAAALPAFED